MLRNATRAHIQRWARLAQAVPGLLALATVSAQAQIVFDGNILWANSDSTLAGQFTGAAGAGAPACAAGYNALQLGTLTFTNNTLADPMLYGVHNIVDPDWRPAFNSPAFAGIAPHGKTVNVPADGWFQPVCFAGALGQQDADWTQGWTYYDSLGAGRQDLHLSGMPDPRPLRIVDHDFFENYAMAPDSNYLLRGVVRVKRNPDTGASTTLTIPAGVVVFQENATGGTLVIERGCYIIAEGTASAPIIITTDLPPGQQVAGATGGLVIHGRARTNVVDSCAGDSAASEGGSIGYYGGDDDADSSGVLRYVRIEYAGRIISGNNERNSFTFNAVGSRTVLEHLQAHRVLDDLFEYFGGAARTRYFVGTDGGDDGYDWQLGFRGGAQFGIIRLLASDAGAERGIEADNNEFDFNTTLCAGRSNPTVSNVTFIGDRRGGGVYTGVRNGIVLRRGTGGAVLNSIVAYWKSPAFRIDDDPTWQAHCAALPAAPGVYCGAGTVDVPVVKSGNVFLTRGYPNPGIRRFTVGFSLPEAADVSVDIYAANGRLVRNLSRGELPAGEQTVTWDVEAGTPAGLYFYKVRALGQEATGRFVRVQ